MFIALSRGSWLAQALRFRLDGEEGFRGSGYHVHVEDGDGSERAIRLLDPESRDRRLGQCSGMTPESKPESTTGREDDEGGA
jgi:hypothetical protein